MLAQWWVLAMVVVLVWLVAGICALTPPSHGKEDTL